MSSSHLRSKVLSAFKNLHKARLQTFSGDKDALNSARVEINKNFRSNKDVEDSAKIEELIVVANDAANILRKHVVQMKEVEKNHFKVNITKETALLDNALFPDVSEKELLKNKKRKQKVCNSRTSNS